jgi:hypothetical protein
METEPLPPDQAIAFVREIASGGKATLGIDRVFCKGNTSVADLEGIADFTMASNGSRDIEADADAACRFIAQASTGDSYFIIVYRE